MIHSFIPNSKKDSDPDVCLVSRSDMTRLLGGENENGTSTIVLVRTSAKATSRSERSDSSCLVFASLLLLLLLLLLIDSELRDWIVDRNT